MLESILNGNLFGHTALGAPQGNAAGSANATDSRNEQKAANPVHLPPPPPGGMSLSAAERYSKADSFSLDLTTKEGDRVTITFDHASDMQASLGATTDGQGGSAAVYNVSRAERNEFQFSVEGDLNDDELEAIQNLIQDVSLIADDFFNGDVQSAFEQASEFEMDRSQLGSMSLNMSRSEQYTAVAAYQEVQNHGNNYAGGQRLGQMADMLNSQRSDSTLSFVDQLGSLQEQILDSLVEQDARYKEANEEQQNKFDQNRNLLYSMLDG